MVTIAEVIRSLFEGFVVSIEIFVLTLLFAIPLGLVISFGSMSKFKPLKYVVKFFIWVIRGTPLMLQLIVIFYGPGLIANWASALNSTNPVIM
jgi:polar amino acid transport system permease protein